MRLIRQTWLRPITTIMSSAFFFTKMYGNVSITGLSQKSNCIILRGVTNRKTGDKYVYAYGQYFEWHMFHTINVYFLYKHSIYNTFLGQECPVTQIFLKCVLTNLFVVSVVPLLARDFQPKLMVFIIYTCNRDKINRIWGKLNFRFLFCVSSYTSIECFVIFETAHLRQLPLLI